MTKASLTVAACAALLCAGAALAVGSRGWGSTSVPVRPRLSQIAIDAHTDRLRNAMFTRAMISLMTLKDQSLNEPVDLSSEARSAKGDHEPPRTART